MIYLERNAEIIAEINEINRNQPLTRGKEVGASSKTFTTAVGSYESAVVGTQLYMVLKESFRSSTDPLERVTRDLVFAAVIYEHLPLLQQELPLFIGLVTDGTGKPISQLTEDFTKGGQYRIRDLFKDEVAGIDSAPQDLKMLIGGEYKGLPYLLSDEELAHMFFETWIGIDSQRRLGDFDTAWLHMSIYGDPHLDLLRMIRGGN